MRGNPTSWVAGKLVTDERLEIVDRTQEDFLVVRSHVGFEFVVAVIGIEHVIKLSDVNPLFAKAMKPNLVINVPSKALWSGEAIYHIHSENAAFGTLGVVSRVAYTDNVGSYHDKNMGFFINAMEQHENVSSVSCIFDSMFKADLRNGSSIVVAVVDAYNMSAEDVRSAKSRYGHFDVVVKASSYGSITSHAEEAAMSMGAEVLTFGGLMQRLRK